MPSALQVSAADVASTSSSHVPVRNAAVLQLPLAQRFAPLYHRLASQLPGDNDRAAAAEFIRAALEEAAGMDDDLPARPGDLQTWMEDNARHVHAQYQKYLDARRQGAPRRYFGNRAHALYFLRNVAPTKLVDGAWLYGLCESAGNPRLADLVRTYLEELGDGDPRKNHVTLYRGLLSRYGLDVLEDLPDALYQQGLVQLALGWNARDFMPEIIGFNLAYEQLPLHLLITAYELNELGIDPYYFTLHVTVDNTDTGHARRACVAAVEAAPRLGDDNEYWQRVRAGARLGNLGPGTLDVIEGFDIEREVLRILAHKAPAGHGAHGDFCKVAGRSVNDWLGDTDALPGFLTALQDAGWIRRGEAPEASRFWRLLQGDRAEMFGVFSGYELQVINDWIRGEASADGVAYDAASADISDGRPVRQMSFRVAERLRAARQQPLVVVSPPELDTDLALFTQRYPTLQADEQRAMLVQAMAPALHWTPVGLRATQLFVAAQV